MSRYTHRMTQIRQRRKAKGLTQAQLAAAAGMSRSYLVEIETGQKPVNTYRLAALAKALGCSPSDLVPGDAVTSQATGILQELDGLPLEDWNAVRDYARTRRLARRARDEG